MKIAVLVKQVPGSESQVSLNGDKSWLDESKITFTMNPPDNYALEESLLIKEKLGSECEIVIISLGPDRVIKVIREGLAKGADRAIHINTDKNNIIDPLSIAKIFSKVLKEEHVDLILTGLQSDDLGMGQTGVLIGELMGMSTATLAIETKIEGESINIKRELEAGWFQWVNLPLPASVSIQSGLNMPRYPSLKGIMGAKRKEIKTLLLSEYYDNNIFQKLNEIALPNKDKKTEIIEGDIDSIIDRIINILKTEIKVF
tara:strand:+ start:43 stop:816 length:774 start_codon:yes stop_codon:yes gene_type:complete